MASEEPPAGDRSSRSPRSTPPLTSPCTAEAAGSSSPRAASPEALQSSSLRSRSALAMTETELRLMAAPATIGREEDPEDG